MNLPQNPYARFSGVNAPIQAGVSLQDMEAKYRNDEIKKYQLQQQQQEQQRQQIAKALETATPEQYNAILNDPAFADMLKYGEMTMKPTQYTPERVAAMRAQAAKAPPGPVGSIMNNISPYVPGVGMVSSQTPEQLRSSLEQQLKNPLTASAIQYNKVYKQPWENAPKTGTAIPEFGGAFFNVPGLSPSSVQKPSGGWEKYQKSVMNTPGAGLVTIGIDPRDPNMEAKAQAWVDYNRARGTGLWQEGAWGNKFGRKDAKMPGFAALQKQYPDAPISALIDYVIRGQYGQSALPPRGIDLGPIGDILTPIVEIAAGAINPFLGAAIGGTLGGLQGGPLGAIIGGAGGYGMGNIGSSLATKGLEGTLSSAWQGAKDFFSSPVSNLSKPFTATDWWTPETAVNAISHVPMPKQDRGYAYGGEVSLPPDLAKYADSPHSDIEQLTNMLRRSNLRAEAVPSMRQSVRQRHMAEIGRMEEPDMAARLGVDLGGMLSYEREF